MQKIYRIGKYSFEYRERVTSGEAFPYIPHFHDSYEIFYFLEGEGDYVVEGKKYPLAPGDVIITNPREMHSPNICSDIYRRITIAIHPLYLSGFITKDYNPFNGFASRPLAEQNRIPAELVQSQGIAQQIRALGEHYCDNKPSRDAMLKAHLLILLEAINGIIGVSKISFAHERIQEIVHYVNDNLTEKISLSGIAEAFYMNKHYLSHTFHDRMGMTLTDYITSKRIQLSLGLISQQCTLLEVALSAGFGDYASFYRAFIKIVGVSPQSYRKNMEKSRGGVKTE
ncbi:MAG: AraC family transcriptional regulator [Ruminococcaceae bacterium]|nr:AraC family transcriptional regulator [Oscillospiraceae bacterium]